MKYEDFSIISVSTKKGIYYISYYRKTRNNHHLWVGPFLSVEDAKMSAWNDLKERGGFALYSLEIKQGI